MHPSDYFNDFYDAVLTGHTNEAQSIIKSLLEHGDTVDAYRIVSQTMYEVGKLWQENSLSVAQEHLATAVSQFVITQLTVQAIKSDQEYDQSVALFSWETKQDYLNWARSEQFKQIHELEKNYPDLELAQIVPKVYRYKVVALQNLCSMPLINNLLMLS